MLRKPLTTWNVNQFRLALALFFLALAVPTVFLIIQAYSQLKWESFHHYRLQAEELVTRINRKYSELIETESNRTFTDYSFLNVAGDNRTNYLQRSPLAKYPVSSSIPGTIGYFQVDNTGKFTTPLLPGSLSKDNRFGLSVKEQKERQLVQTQIYTILSQNQLINRSVDKIIDKDHAAKPRLETAAPAATRSAAGQNMGQQASEPTTISNLSEPTTNIISQSAFDALESNKQLRAPVKQPYSKSLGRVEDLDLKKKYSEQSAESKAISREAEQPVLERQKPGLRKEQNILPAPLAGKKDKSLPALHLNMFESEIDAFEFSILESGHFILYRKVWKNGQRFIQGMLIEPNDFINGIIRRAFYDTSVSNASNLTVAYQGNILTTLGSKSSRKIYSSARDLQGTLLLQNRLNGTLDQLELIFSINNLPAGPGGTVIIWLSFILILILFGGFYTMYQLGLKQIHLARQQQDFVSAVSHELKTPLTSIRMYSEMLREGWVSDEKRSGYYDYIYTESERLTRLINNVLQLARLGRNEIHIALKPLTVVQLLDTVKSKISSQAERAGFKLVIDCNDSVPETLINVDEDYFSQIMINLVDNAIKFSSRADKKQIDILCIKLQNNKIQIRVRDYGPGINKDQIKKIFQLFYRTENELTRNTVGTGIGLSLVKQLTSYMNADIDVLNKHPGVEFQITFPANLS